MSQPLIKTDAEIRLLTEMLADEFLEDGLPFSGASTQSPKCPAPAVLWALFEPAAEETAWTSRMREHVKRCSECSALVKGLKGFVAASDDHSKVPTEYEAAWNSAEQRMERNIQKRLSLQKKPYQEPWWKFEWLPSMAIAYTLAGCAAVLLILGGMTFFFAAEKSDPASNQLAQSEADIWKHPEAQGSDSKRPVTPDSSPTEGVSPAVDSGVVSSGEPGVASQPAMGSPTQPDSSVKSEAGEGARSGMVAVASEATNAAMESLSVELKADMRASVQILLARREGGGTHIEAALTPLPATDAPSVLFSARVEDGSGPVRLLVDRLERDGRRMKIQERNVNTVTVQWPDAERRPLAGQSFEVKILSGATLKSETEKK